MTDSANQKWFMYWSHGRDPRSKKTIYVLVEDFIYNDEESIKAEVEVWARDEWRAAETYYYGWEEAEPLPEEILAKKLEGARRSVERSREFLRYLENYAIENGYVIGRPLM